MRVINEILNDYKSGKTYIELIDNKILKYRELHDHNDTRYANAESSAP